MENTCRQRQALLLLTRKRDLNQFSDYDAHMVGDYAVVVCAK